MRTANDVLLVENNSRTTVSTRSSSAHARTSNATPPSAVADQAYELPPYTTLSRLLSHPPIAVGRKAVPSLRARARDKPPTSSSRPEFENYLDSAIDEMGRGKQCLLKCRCRQDARERQICDKPPPSSSRPEFENYLDSAISKGQCLLKCRCRQVATKL